MRLGAQAPRLAVGLTRVSTAEQGQSGLGLEAQLASVRAYVAAKGWTLVVEFSDLGVTPDRLKPVSITFAYRFGAIMHLRTGKKKLQRQPCCGTIPDQGRNGSHFRRDSRPPPAAPRRA